jgi:amidophosphoribosyltransferase
VRKELIASTHTIEEIRQYIGADSLRFISLEGLSYAMQGIKPEDMCYACFNGEHPLLPDGTPEFERQLCAKINNSASAQQEEK